MFKKIFKCATLCMVMQVATLSFAQDEAVKVKPQEGFNYSRASISVVKVDGNYSQYGDVVVDALDLGDKFDINDINTKSLPSVESLLSSNIGNQVLLHWLGYDGVAFNSNVLEERSMYNATDQDVLLDQAAKVASLKTQGRKLMNNSYILLVTPQNLKESRETDKKGNVKVRYNGTVEATVYKLDFNDELLSAVWDNWISVSDTTMTESDYYQKASFFNNLKINAEHVATESNTCSANTPEEAFAAAASSLIFSLEKKIDGWQVVSTIYSKHPITAKLGTKEGLKNSQRFRAYKVVEDEEGNVKYKGLGYLRVTHVADNSSVATGETTDLSKFYQISGGKLREGMILKQKNDARMGISLEYNFMPSYSLAEISVDFLTHTSTTMGIMQYVFLKGGYDKPYKDSDEPWYVQAKIGYGIGIHPIRPIEIMPYAFFGADLMNLKDSDDGDDDDSFTEKMALMAGGGVKISFQIAYPVQLFVKAEYAKIFDEGKLYIPRLEREFLVKQDKIKDFSVGAGFRVAF